MAPYKHRGKFNLGFQLSITIGILFANILNYFFSKIDGGWGWRLSLGFAALPALIIIIASIFLSDTPTSLLERGKEKEARELLQRIRGVDNVFGFSRFPTVYWNEYYHVLCSSALQDCWVWKRCITCVCSHHRDVNMVATFVSIYGIDRWGRRALLIQGSIQMLVFLAAVGALIATKFGLSGNVTTIPSWFAIVMVVCICCFVAGFAWSWWPLGWLIPSEIFPLEIRSAAQSITVATNVFFTFLIAQVFLTLLCHMKFGLFFFFAACVLVMTLFVFFFLPETKNIPRSLEKSLVLEEIYQCRAVPVSRNSKPKKIS
ncbi:hypothetical protein Leryth_018038 [Lithospermum erythrorhizon]|uniref:Secondary carrier transporter n=1 Tax=Lithospermum erythrorhizon TaxID=34254 RepID=A0AAV3PL50_LITER|nr:hypothetical protein Leryth_018038 [Lithospermum erythrorhizon]